MSKTVSTIPRRATLLPAVVSRLALLMLAGCPARAPDRGEAHPVTVAPPAQSALPAAPEAIGGARMLKRIARHGGPTLIADEEAKAVVFSPDGQWLASGGGEGGSITLWDARTGQRAGALQGERSAPTKLVFSPDGALLGASDLSRRITLWDVAARKVQRVLEGHEANVYAFTFSRDGKLLASLDADGVIRIWDLTAPQAAPRALASPSPSTGELAFSPDGRSLAAPRDGGFVATWDVATGKKIRESGGSRAVRGLTYSGDGKALITGETLLDGSEALVLRDASTLAIKHTLLGHTGHINAVQATRDDRLVVSGSGDGTVRVWDAGTGQAVHTIAGGGTPIWSLSLSPDGALVAAAGGGRKIQLSRTATGERAFPAADHEATIAGLAFSPDGKLLASGDADGKVVLRDAATGLVKIRLPKHPRAISALAFSPDGSRLLSVSTGEARFSDPQTGAELMTLPAGRFDALTFSPDGRTLSASDASRIVRLLDASTGALIKTFGAAEPHDDIRQNLMTPSSVSFSADGKQLAVARWDQPVQIWDIATGTLVRTLPGTLHVAYAPRSDLIAANIGSISKRRTLLQLGLWDASTGTLRFTLEGSSAPTFSPDGRLVLAFSDQAPTPPRATGGRATMDDRELRLWSVQSGQLLGRASSPGHRPTVLSISPDGKRVATGGVDAAVVIYDLEGIAR